MRKVVFVAAAVMAASGLTFGRQQPPAAGSAVPPGQGATAPAQATNLGCRCQRQPAAARAQDGSRLELRRGQGLRLHASRPARPRQRQAGPRPPDLDQAASSGDSPDVRDRDLRPHAGEDAGGHVEGDGNGRPRARRRGGDEEDRRHRLDRRAGCAADQVDALYAGRREHAGAGDPARQLRRRSAATGARRGEAARAFHPTRRSPPRSSAAAGATRPSGIRTSSRIGSTRSRRASSAPRSRPDQQQPAPDEWGTISAWSWGVSRMIDYLETDKVRERQADRAVRSLASGEDRAVGDGEGRADRGGVLELFGRDGCRAGAARLGRDGRRHGAELPLAVRRQFPEVGRAAGTRCRSMRTC